MRTVSLKCIVFFIVPLMIGMPITLMLRETQSTLLFFFIHVESCAKVRASEGAHAHTIRVLPSVTIPPRHSEHSIPSLSYFISSHRHPHKSTHPSRPHIHKILYRIIIYLAEALCSPLSVYLSCPLLPVMLTTVTCRVLHWPR